LYWWDKYHAWESQFGVVTLQGRAHFTCWKDNIKCVLVEAEGEGFDYMKLTQGRVCSTLL
jgi:hypothetical protein